MVDFAARKDVYGGRERESERGSEGERERERERERVSYIYKDR